MTLKYFGTDGIRGRVGEFPITPDFCRRVGYALGSFLKHHNVAKPVTVALGRDTRASSEVIEKQLREGFQFHNILVHSLGVVPTPAVSKSVKDLHADLGVMITASHNPASDNGIKLFDNTGVKFSQASEFEIESCIDKQVLPSEVPKLVGDFHHDGLGHYINFLRSLMHQSCLTDWKIVIDTANGATYQACPAVFEHFGAQLTFLGNHPQDDNINKGVGSEYPETLAKTVLKEKAKLGIALDGDGDRALLVDERGSVLSGEEVLGLLAFAKKQKGKLNQDTLVTTVQSNMGLDKALSTIGCRTERVSVGDRNVLHRLLEGGFSLGGESSGHFIFMDYCNCGDGILTAIKVIEVMMESNQPLSQLRKQIRLLPQQTQNVDLVKKIPLEDCATLQQAMTEIESELAGEGRLLLRYSGTEPKLRILLESEKENYLKAAMAKILHAVDVDLKSFSRE